MEPLQMNEKTAPELPDSWVWTTLGEIGLVVSGYGFPKKYQGKTNDDIPFFKVKDISKTVLSDNIFMKVAENYISKDECNEIRAKLIKKDTVVFAKIGEAIKLNRRAILWQDSLVDNNVMGFSSNIEILNNLYIFYLFLTIKLGDYSRATTVPSVRKSDIEQISLPLPPLPEQHRIVTKIEELFTQLDAGVSSLKKTQAQLKQYRQSVLKSACEGKLVSTEAELAQAEGREYELADVLLERILKERRENWEEEQKRKKSAKYKEPAAPDVGGLGELPEGWVWVNIGQLSWYVKDGPHYSPKYSDEGIPFISGGNVRPSGVDFASAKRITPELHAELSSRCKPEKGDILYTKGGTTGIARVNTYDIEFNVWVHVAVLKLANSIEPFYVQHALNSPFCYAQAQRFTHGVGNQDLGLTRMINIIVSLPPLAEQHRIVAEIERRLSVADEIEKTIEQSLKQAERLRQSILKKAFEGKLVPQNPDDESASLLLERIGEEKAKVEAETKKNRKSKAKKNTKEK